MTIESVQQREITTVHFADGAAELLLQKERWTKS